MGVHTERHRGESMRCKQAHKLLGPYMDGELGAADSSSLEKHLESCEDCAGQLAFLRGITREISALPAVVPTAEESRRLRERIRGEITDQRAPRPLFRRVQVAAAAAVLLIVTGVGVTWAVLSTRGAQPGGEVAVSQQEQPAGEAVTDYQALEPGEEGTPRAATAPNLVASALPEVNTSGREYSTGDLEAYDNDLGSRLDFYSAYWHPMNGAGVQAADMGPLQESLKEDMARKAERAGQNPETLKSAVDSALSRADRANLLPCYAELARLNGNEVWLVSLSGPEDYLLFNNPDIVPAMSMASIFGQEGVSMGRALIDELARQLFPYYSGSLSTVVHQVGTSAADQAPEEAPPEGELETPTAQPGGDAVAAPEGELTERETTEEQREFQAFLRQVVTRGNIMDLLSVLEGLNYEQLLIILQGSWSALGGDSLDLGEFLVPPKRLCAVDTQTGEVLYQP